MAYQRPGARVIASEFEWQTVGRCVLPDAVPIIILWPFSPIHFEAMITEALADPNGRVASDLRRVGVLPLPARPGRR
jgi:hypothetical protein